MDPDTHLICIVYNNFEETYMINDSIFFVDKVDEISVCDSTVFYFTGSSFARPLDFKKIENKEHNLNTCKNCEKNHKLVLKRLEKRFLNFPFCCVPHRKLSTENWFKRSDFEKVPKLTTDKIFFTWDFIQKFIDDDNWEEEINDYLSHVIETFGSFPLEHGEPLFLSSYMNGVKELLNGLNEKKHAKKKRIILDHINGYYNTNPKNKNTDFNVLLSIYDKWYKTFPFDMSIFKNLKEKFSKTIPIIERTRYNKYSESSIAFPRTKSNLVKLLCNVTNEIITKINSLKLYEQGKLTDIENYKLEVVIQKRNLKLRQGYHNETKEPNSRYRKILKSWYADEIEFIKELQSTLKTIGVKKNNLFLDIIYACSKMQENSIFWKADENVRTKQILDLLEISYHTKDQSQIGISATGKKAGSIDGLVIDKKRTEYIIEALNLQYLNRNVIQSHISKLEKNYDSRGLKTKFLILYCDIADNTFEEFCEKYISYIDMDVLFQNPKENIEILDHRYANQRLLKTLHNRENTNVIIYHILLKMQM